MTGQVRSLERRPARRKFASGKDVRVTNQRLAAGLASWERGVCSMSKRMPAPSRRSLHPTAEGLETRQLLNGAASIPKGQPTKAATAVVSGMDPDGAMWTLRLFGPGALNVVGVNGDTFTRQTGTLQESIQTIFVAGAITTETRLVGTVYP